MNGGWIVKRTVLTTLVGMISALFVVLSVVGAVPAHAAAARPNTNIGGCILHEGHQLNGDTSDSMTCTNTDDRMVMQADGNLVVKTNSTVDWANGKNGLERDIGTNHVHYWAIMQNDGNFVEYCTGGSCGSGALALWATNTNDGSFGDSNQVELDYQGSRGEFWIISVDPNPLILPDSVVHSCHFNQVCWS